MTGVITFSGWNASAINFGMANYILVGCPSRTAALDLQRFSFTRHCRITQEAFFGDWLPLLVRLGSRWDGRQP